MKASRRNFLIGTGVVGGGLVVAFAMRPGPGAPRMVAVADAHAPNAFLQLGPDNTVRFYCPRDEMGQGVTTGLATLIGEELDFNPANFVIEMGAPHPDYTNPLFGLQATGGSTSMAAHFMQLRQVGADTRRLILDAAAVDLGVPAADLTTDDGYVVAGNKRHPYGKFVATASVLPVPEATPLKSPADFDYIGKEMPRIDSLDKATGVTEFGLDVELPDMHYAVVRHAPVAGGSVKSFDASRALAMPGVVEVAIVATGIGVVAEKYWQAKKAEAVLEVEWDLPDLRDVDTERLRADYLAALDEEGESAEEEGDLALGFQDALSVSADYWAPYLAHAPMEPMNAVVRIENGTADVWSGTQGIGIAQGIVARVADLDKENVRAHNTYLGGGFGRRATLTHVVEATELAMATGKPIKVLWSREDDIRAGVFRPASMMRINAAIAEDGTISAWRAKRSGGNIIPETLRNAMPGALPTAIPDGFINWAADVAEDVFGGWMVDGSSVEGLAGDYDFPNREVLHVTRDHGLPLTFWRSVGHSYTAFAKESMVDELAAAQGLDPIEVRLKNTETNPRLNNVIRIAAEKMRAMRPGEGRALGFAAHSSFNSAVAEVAEVSVVDGQVKVHSVLCVIDCGLAVNPDVVRAQMEGGVMYGLTAALHGQLDLDAGSVTQSNFHDYPILRMDEAPSVDVVIVPNDGAPTGVGEPAVPPVAAAVANAVFNLTGERLRELPLKPTLA